MLFTHDVKWSKMPLIKTVTLTESLNEALCAATAKLLFHVIMRRVMIIEISKPGYFGFTYSGTLAYLSPSWFWVGSWLMSGCSLPVSPSKASRLCHQ